MVDYQPQTLEQIRQEPTFQHGGSPLVTRFTDQGRLDSENQFERDIILCIHQESWSLLSFLWENKPFQFTRVPFGLSCVPRAFTSVEAGCSIPQREGHQIVASSKKIAQDHLYLILNILEILGFLVH